ncbi:hypothetical protein J2S66_004594 [Saccharothrix longispora]|nr:hypothetical protein [Saccharothrix longispora]
MWDNPSVAWYAREGCGTIPDVALHAVIIIAQRAG